jgi:hypothetical protein
MTLVTLDEDRSNVRSGHAHTVHPKFAIYILIVFGTNLLIWTLLRKSVSLIASAL